MLFYRFIVKPINTILVPKKYRPTVRQFCYWLRSFWYVGDRVTCCCCGGRFRKFLQYGVNPRGNALCPRCGSKERHRMLWLYLKEQTNLLTDRLRVLHFAPEYVFRRPLSALPNLLYVTADLDSLLAMLKADITHIPCRDAAFDVVLCSHVLEHVKDDQRAMREIFRVLRPGGWAILQVPVDRNRRNTFEDDSIVTPEDRERWFLQKDHVRIYGRDYKERLKRAGFNVHVDYFARDLPDDLRIRYGLRRKRPIYYCTKDG